MEEELMIDEGGAANTEEQAGAQSNDEGTAEQGRKYTDADLDKIIARKIAKERERMSKLFNEEQQESKIDNRERTVLMRELKADAKDKLIEQGLPSSLANLLNYDSKGDMEHSLEEVETIFSAAVQEGIKYSLRGRTPRTGSTGGTDMGIRNAFAPKAL